MHPISSSTAYYALADESLRHGWSLPRRIKSRLSIFVFAASFFWTFDAGCGTAFRMEAAIFHSPFRATVDKVIFEGRDGRASEFWFPTSGNLGVGFAGRGRVA